MNVNTNNIKIITDRLLNLNIFIISRHPKPANKTTGIDGNKLNLV